MIAKALGYGLMGTIGVFVILAMITILPIIIIFLIITGVAYVVLKEKAEEEHHHKLPRDPP